jgi:serine transporter
MLNKKNNNNLQQHRNKQDTVWMLGLYGTAIGAGTLFLPINAGIGGFWPLIVIALLSLPLSYFSHRALCRFVLSGSKQDEDITAVVIEHFGNKAGFLITLLYLFAIYPILLVYSVAITNTLIYMVINQFHVDIANTISARAMFSLFILLGLMSIIRMGGDFIVKAMSMLVYPVISALMIIAIYLYPNWNMSMIANAGSWSTAITTWTFYRTLWLALPVMVFSFNHSPIISSFALGQKKNHQVDAEFFANKILLRANIMMVLSVLFFVFSCVFSLSPQDLLQAKMQNISILSYLANHFSNPVISKIAPIIAIIAIGKSFLGHYLGAKEGLNGLMTNRLSWNNKIVQLKNWDKITAIFMFLTCWLTATINPSILTMIETLGGPIIAILLFLMPVYAVYNVPNMNKYKKDISNIFLLIIGCITLSAIFYKLFF